MLELNTVHHGDCLDILAKIPDESVDLIFADLPFYQDNQEELQGEHYAGMSASERKLENYTIWNAKLVLECSRVLKEGGNVILVNAPKYILMTAHIWLSKFDFRSQVPLIRRGSLRPAWMLGFQHNIMLFLVKGDKKLKWNGARVNHAKEFPTDVWLDIPYQNGYRGKGKNNWHPEAINLPVVERAVDLNSFPGDVVLDITAGSGTTGVACMRLNRNYILVEKREDYFELIKNRLLLEKQKLLDSK
jgi:site-specific DNA-methyltransferase (adenine-specific)